MGEAIPEEIEQHVEEEVTLAKWEAEKMVERQLAAKLEPLLQKVEKKLEERGLNPEEPAIQNAAIESLVEMVTGEWELGETVEMPVGGRNNKGVSTEVTLPRNQEVPTKTIEVPIEGGDVEDPDTVEREVPDLDQSEFDFTEEYHEWSERVNVEQSEEDQGSELEEPPMAGFPWYQ